MIVVVVGSIWMLSGHLPARPFPSSIFLDKNRRDIGKYQSIWTDSKVETAGSPHLWHGDLDLAEQALNTIVQAVVTPERGPQSTSRQYLRTVHSLSSQQPLQSIRSCLDESTDGERNGRPAQLTKTPRAPQASLTRTNHFPSAKA
jgi:hypothetical protein